MFAKDLQLVGQWLRTHFEMQKIYRSAIGSTICLNRSRLILGRATKNDQGYDWQRDVASLVWSHKPRPELLPKGL